jgi:hypothetical protein
VATLLFSRWCPRYLDFSALFVGSITPDLATSIDDWEYFSHTVLGTLVFCLPVGLVTLWIFHQVRAPLVATFPNPHRDALLPLCTGTSTSLFHVIISLLVGSWFHIIWDLFTHDYSWLVQHVALFTFRVAGVPLNHVLWLLSSLGGGVLLLVVYLSLLQKGNARIVELPRSSEGRAYAVWSGILLFPLSLAVPLALHEAKPFNNGGSLIRYLAMYYLGCAYLTLALTGFFLKSRSPRVDR